MITLDKWQAGGKYLTLNGHKIFTREGGDPTAPVLLLIHGYPSASWDWEAMWVDLSQKYYVITLDMLGFGLSEKPKNIQYLITEQANIFEAYLLELKISSYHILAHDYGDTVAQELLARHNERTSKASIESVCFLNGGLFPETHKPVLIQKLLLSPIGFLISRLTTKQKLAANFYKIFGEKTPPTPMVIDTLWSLLEFNDGRLVMHKLIHYIIQRRENRARWVGAIINASIPVKLIAGAQDPISGKHMIEYYRDIIPNADVTELSLLGHYPQVEDANAITHAYLDFRQHS